LSAQQRHQLEGNFGKRGKSQETGEADGCSAPVLAGLATQGRATCRSRRCSKIVRGPFISYMKGPRPILPQPWLEPAYFLARVATITQLCSANRRLGCPQCAPCSLGCGVSTGRVAVIGDVGGHHDELLAELVQLGMDSALVSLPDDLSVVQVGDLVHRGPDSAGVVELIDAVMDANPGRWVQLLGNHEELYIDAKPRFEWIETLPYETTKIIRRWWTDGSMGIAAAIDAADGQWLVTHAGLTERLWRRLRSPRTPAGTVEAINSLIGTAGEIILRRAGTMLYDRRDLMAGPIWASAGIELLPSWLEVGEMPFSQIHGHSSIVDWSWGTEYAPPAVIAATQLDHAARHETTVIGDQIIVGVDPGHGESPAAKWSALVIQNATISARRSG
jgi:hypothetical protein